MSLRDAIDDSRLTFHSSRGGDNLRYDLNRASGAKTELEREEWIKRAWHSAYGLRKTYHWGDKYHERPARFGDVLALYK